MVNHAHYRLVLEMFSALKEARLVVAIPAEFWFSITFLETTSPGLINLI